ncbi:hypothetical protein DET49_1472 [Salegentibacter sp. 24]|nr:hypothetical protein DET49_1472 [Salegentibacter sp. 24]
MLGFVLNYFHSESIIEGSNNIEDRNLTEEM